MNTANIFTSRTSVEAIRPQCYTNICWCVGKNSIYLVECLQLQKLADLSEKYQTEMYVGLLAWKEVT